tara:strand:+ start:1737 stop:3494 length:1758 start_codon:yes stop_codon:yes gene_type:complete
MNATQKDYAKSIPEKLAEERAKNKAMKEAMEKKERQWQYAIQKEREERLRAETEARHEKEAAEKLKDEMKKLRENPQKLLLQKELMDMKTKEHAKGKKVYYDNQEKTALDVVEYINNPDIMFQIVIAPCQAGKTGCMVGILDILAQSETEIDINNVLVITGLSSKDWSHQTKSRLPPSMGNKIFHRAEVKKAIMQLKKIKNCVLIIDECQIANSNNMSIGQMFQEAGFKDLEYIKNNNINIIEFSATPNSLLDDMQLWDPEEVFKKHIMTPGTGYKGHIDLLENGRLFEAEDLYIDDEPSSGMSEEEERILKEKIQPSYDTINKIQADINTRYNRPKHHIFRLPLKKKTDTVVSRFKLCGGEQYEYVVCNSNTEEELLVELNKIPTKHKFIFIKENARCAVTLPNKENIGVLYERVAISPDDSVIVQGLAGRACGYDVPDDMIVYTNIPSIEKYVDMIKSNFENTKDFIFKGKKSTYMHPNTFSENKAMTTKQPVDFDYKHFENDDEAINFIKDIFKKKTKISKNAPATCMSDGQNPSLDYVVKRKWGLGGGIIQRAMRLNDGTICVYWKVSGLSEEQKAEIAKL